MSMADTFIQVNVVWEAPLKGDCQREAAPQAADGVRQPGRD